MIQRSWSLLAGALLCAAAPPPAGMTRDGEVRAVSLQPAAGRAELVIAVQGAVVVTDRTLPDPSRIVLDVTGATLSPGMERVTYDGVKRAGVLNVRVKQFTPDVVRIVLDMEQLVPYRVERSAEAIRVSFGSGQTFVAWNTGAATVTEAPAAARVEAPAAVLATAAAEDVTETARPVVRVQGGQIPRVTVSWVNASIDEVISGFQAISGRSIILGKGITRTVTAEIRDKPWPEAFYAILAAQGLSVQELPGGILRVDAPQNFAEIDSLEPRETRIVRVNYARVGEMANSLKGVLSKRGVATPDTASNSIILTDAKSNLESAIEFVNLLDLRPKMSRSRPRSSSWTGPIWSSSASSTTSGPATSSITGSSPGRTPCRGTSRTHRSVPSWTWGATSSRPSATRSRSSRLPLLTSCSLPSSGAFRSPASCRPWSR
ncbi:MAG TPA: secretin N-terminal domain-containing protein [Gemmatimonadales bacterium]|nr:secretin N-terminal domain-containing protein [Gemmatimonadales bacterium]